MYYLYLKLIEYLLEALERIDKIDASQFTRGIFTESRLDGLEK